MTSGSAEKTDQVVQVFDGHNDVLLAMFQPEFEPAWGGARSFFERSERGHLDLPRAREAGFAGGVVAVWVTPDPAARRPDLTGKPEPKLGELPPGEMPPEIGHSYALRLAMAETATLFRLEAASAGAMKVVRDVKELRQCLDAGVLAAILHFEGAEMIDVQLNSLEVFYQAGLRSLGPAWSRPNAFARSESGPSERTMTVCSVK